MALFAAFSAPIAGQILDTNGGMNFTAVGGYSGKILSKEPQYLRIRQLTLRVQVLSSFLPVASILHRDTRLWEGGEENSSLCGTKGDLISVSHLGIIQDPLGFDDYWLGAPFQPAAPTRRPRRCQVATFKCLIHHGSSERHGSLTPWTLFYHILWDLLRCRTGMRSLPEPFSFRSGS